MIEGGCTCGSVRVELSVERVRTSLCHCYDCKKRTGSAFGIQTRIEKTNFSTSGVTNTYSRTGDGGNEITFHFCPTCATTLFWFIPMFPDDVLVAAGIFELSAFSSPVGSFYEDRVPEWLALPDTITFRMD